MRLPEDFVVGMGYILSEPKVSCIGASVAEHFCPFLMGATAKMPFNDSNEGEKYIRDHVVGWFNWSRGKGMPVERMEELVLVYGCTSVTSWAAAAFDDYGDAQISRTNGALSNRGTNFRWGNIRGIVEYHDGQVDPVCSTLATSTRRALRFTVYFFVVLKEWPTRGQESLRFHQVLPSKARLVLDQTPPGRGRTPSRRP
jgi:hypothetical protein